MKKVTMALIFLFASILPVTSWAQAGATTGEAAVRAPDPNAAVQRDNKDTKGEKPSGSSDLKYIAVALAIGLAALGGAIGQGLAGSGAIAGVARNPGAKSAVQTLLLLTLVLIESLVIYALVVSLLLYAKL